MWLSFYKRHKNAVFFLVIFLFGIVTLLQSLQCIVDLSFSNHREFSFLNQTINSAFSLHTFLLGSTLLLCLSCIIFKRISPGIVVICLLLSYDSKVYHLINEQIHPIFFQLGLLNFMIPSDREVVNPQYTTIFLFLLLLLSLFTLTIRKKTRSLDRMFISLIGLTVFLTTLLFHSLIPMGYFQLSKNTAANHFMYQLSTSGEQACKQYLCLTYDGENYSDEQLSQKYIPQIQPAIDAAKKQNKPLFVYFSDFSGLRFDYDLIMIDPTLNHMTIFIDNKSLREHSRMSEAVFMLLSSFAHWAWVFGGLLVLFMHKSMLKRRRNF